MVEPKGQEGGGKGRWCPGEGQLGWKEPRGVGLALLCSDSQGDGAVEADLITPWGGQTLPRRVRGYPVEKTHFSTQIPTILSSLSWSSSPDGSVFG